MKQPIAREALASRTSESERRADVRAEKSLRGVAASSWQRDRKKRVG